MVKCPLGAPFGPRESFCLSVPASQLDEEINALAVTLLKCRDREQSTAQQPLTYWKLLEAIPTGTCGNFHNFPSGAVASVPVGGEGTVIWVRRKELSPR